MNLVMKSFYNGFMDNHLSHKGFLYGNSYLERGNELLMRGNKKLVEGVLQENFF